MRKRISPLATVALLAGAVACTGRTSKPENERVAQANDKRGTYERVTLQGCLQPAPGNKEYVLRNVVVPPPAEQPQGQETMEHPIVPAGSWVRLTSGDDLKDYLGKRVAVSGDVTDRGNNTLGTSGRTTPAKEAETPHEKFAQSSKDAKTNPDRAMPPTTVAPMGANANGMAPQIAVERISTIAGSCEGGTKNNPLPAK